MRNGKDIHVTKDANRRDNRRKIKNKFIEIPHRKENKQWKNKKHTNKSKTRERKEWKDRQFQGRDRDARNMKTKERETQKETGERIILIQLWRQSRNKRGTAMHERGAQER